MRITYVYLTRLFILCFYCLSPPSYSINKSEQTLTNGYDQHASLPEKCNLVSCSKKLLLKAFRKLQLEHFPLNYDIPTRSHDKNTLRVVTYNVHFWQDAREKIFSESYNAAKSMIGELVEMDADVYLLQEVVYEEGIIQRLLEELDIPDSQYFFCSETGNKKGSYSVGNLSLFRVKSKHLYKDEHYYHPEQTANDLTSDKVPHGRCAVINTLRPEGTDKTLQFVNIHLDHTDDSAHKQQQLEGVLKMMAADPYHSQIDYQFIGGDFNIPMAKQLSKEKQQALQQEARSRNTEINLHLLELLEKQGYVDSFDHSGINPPGATTWSLARIDYLFLKLLNGSKLHFTGQYLFHTLNSDHNPLVFDMKFTP